MNMKKLTLFALIALVLAGCAGGGTQTARKVPVKGAVSGNSGDVLVVLDKADWEGAIGGELRSFLGCDCPYLAMPEPLFNLKGIQPSEFKDTYRKFRNILLYEITPDIENAGISTTKSEWARTQCKVTVKAHDSGEALSLTRSNFQTIIDIFEKAERDRLIQNTAEFEAKSVTRAMKDRFNGSPHFPDGFKVLKEEERDDLTFAWVANDKDNWSMIVFMYKFPYVGEEQLTLDEIARRRTEIGRNFVPGPVDNSWMVTSFLYGAREIEIGGRSVTQVRGHWGMENYYMGGPFVSHTFLSRDSSEVIVLDAMVYGPRYDKLPFVRQLEAILYSWEWKYAVE